MADIKISELEPTTDLEGLYTLGSDKNNLSKKVSLQFLKTAADYANTQGDYAKGVADGIAGLLGIEEYSQFSESVEYPALTVVMYNGQLYRFTQTHYAGAWLGTDVEKTSVKGVIRSVGLGNRTNEDVTTTMALRKRVDYDRYVGSLKIMVGDQEYSGTILNISADSYNAIDGYPELKVRFFVGTTLYEALNEGSTAWQISKVTDVAEWEQKLAQLDQDWDALKAQIQDAVLKVEVAPHIEVVTIEGGAAILQPDKLYDFGEVANLAIGFEAPIEGKAANYAFQFKSPASAPTTITMPDSVVFPVESDSMFNVKAGRTYQVTILNNLASASSWEV